MIRINEADQLQIERELGRRSFKHFARMSWHILEPGAPLKWGWAVEAICDHLQAVAEGHINRLLMNVPPGCMKSLLTGVMWPAWCWTRWPHRRYLGTAHAERLAIRDSTKCRRLITSDWYQKRWPITLMSDSNAKLKFENSFTGFREAMPFTSLTGSRGDALIIDDPLSVDDGNSEAALLAAEITFFESVPTRLNNDDSAIVIIMQRLHEKDTSGLVLERMPDTYVHLCLPMEFEPDRRCVTPIFIDPRIETGELLFPERFNAAKVAELQLSLGSYGSAGQLQQRPSPRGGGLFKEEWWKYWTVEPDCVYRTIYADTAQKVKIQNDYTVLQCWGRTTTGRAALLDQVRGKWEAPELLTQSRAFYNKHRAGTNGVMREMKVEDKVSGTGLIQQLQREGLPVRGIQRDKDKITRAMDAIPLIEAGNAILPANAPWLSDYLKEFSAFPNGAHDDQIDPTCDAINDMMGQISIFDVVD